MQVDYMETRPRLFKKTASGWVEYDFEFEKKDDETFFYTSGKTRLIGAYEELDYLHAVLVPLLPHPLLVSIRRKSAMFLSHVFRVARRVIPGKQSNRESVKRWELVHEIVKNLGNDWHVKSARLWDGGVFNGNVLGPDNMELYFKARAKKVERGYERTYPPPGWVRVNGRISFIDGNVDLMSYEGPLIAAEISIELHNSMTADEMAKEIIVHLLPLYAGFLSVVEKYKLELGTKS